MKAKRKVKDKLKCITLPQYASRPKIQNRLYKRARVFKIRAIIELFSHRRMAKDDENPIPPQALKPVSSPKPAQKPAPLSQSKLSEEAHNASNISSPVPSNVKSSIEFIRSVAAKIAAQPFQFSDPDVWGVLTAISEKARKRHQGMNMLLTSDKHCIGRLVDDARFQIIAPAVSALHCKIYRRIGSGDIKQGSDNCFSVFLKDCSTNGTYLNWEKLTKSSSEAKLCHGDIISIAFVPQHELAFAFVFHEVQKSSYVTDGTSLKKKSDEHGAESKRLKGIGIGASDGPISLDDFRSLQRSNTELRKHLEDQVVTVESLRAENHAVTEKHEIELRELKESVAKSYQNQLSQLNQSLEAKDKELAELNKTLAEQNHGIEDLNERLGASMQSCLEANQIINSQKASISKLKALLDEERGQMREEIEKASLYMKVAIQRAQAKATEEIKRVSDGALRREKERQEMINKLQEADKERCSLVETLISKLKDTRQNLANSDNRVRQLEGQMHEEQQTFAITQKRVEELEHERKRLRKELEHEKASREEAWSKVSALELEISAAVRDLDFERRRLKAAMERIMLRETQLRAFYSTTEEISALFAKQQEQLKSMQRTLEDEENYETMSTDIDLTRAACNRAELSSNEASVTEKHECSNIRSQDENRSNTQEVEFVGPFKNSHWNEIGTEQITEGCPVETEKVLETESQHTSRNINFDSTMHVEETIKTSDLHGENDVSHSPESENGVGDEGGDVYGGGGLGHDSSSLVVAESRHMASIELLRADAERRRHERRALSEMIGIVAPDLKEQFSRAVGPADDVAWCGDDDDADKCGHEVGLDDDDVAGGSERVMSEDKMEEEDEDDDTREDSMGDSKSDNSTCLDSRSTLKAVLKVLLAPTFFNIVQGKTETKAMATAGGSYRNGVHKAPSLRPSSSFKTKNPPPVRRSSPASLGAGADSGECVTCVDLFLSVSYLSRSVSGRVRVAVRLRPRNSVEMVADADFADCVELQPELKRLKLRKNNWDSDTYEFDEVLTEFASQKRVYEVVAKPVVESVLDGYNGTVMAYGQTGTGKTYTLGRLGDEDTSARGIMVRSMEDILANISPDTDSILVSYLQLYMETIQDLLNPANDNISIVEDQKTGDVSLPGATVLEIRDQQSFVDLLRVGEAHRIAANTKLNTESSRSHALLMVQVKKSVSDRDDFSVETQDRSNMVGNMGPPMLRKGKLIVVDLAGSERIHKSGSEGHVLEEAKSINLSLSALGKCINALAENSSHVPVRDSKLTRLLKDSFGGTSRTSLVVTIGPSPRHRAETASTILFGQRAMKVENMLKIKEEFDYRSLSKRLEIEIDKLIADNERQQKVYENEIERIRLEAQKRIAEAERTYVEVLEEEKTKCQMDYVESIKKLEEKWTLNQQKLVSNGEVCKDAGNEEVAELKTLLQNEVCLRKAAEEEIQNLKNQLQLSKIELAGGNSNDFGGLHEVLEEESRQKKKLEEEVRILRSQVAQLSMEANQTKSKQGRGNFGNPLLGIDCLTPLNHLRSRDGNNGEKASITNLHEQVGLQKILSLLESEDANVRIHAVKVVANLAAEEANQEKIVEAGGLSSLLMLLRTYEDETIRRIAAGAIANLAMNEANQELIMAQGGICLLATTATDAEDPQTLRMVAGAIANLCGNDKLQARLRSEGGIKALLGMVRCRHPDVISQVARGIANFAKCESRASSQGIREGRSLLIEDGALPWIVQNANNEASLIRRHVELALCHLAQHEVNAIDMINGGALWELVRISRDCSREDIRALARRTLTSSSTFQFEMLRLRIEI
ncbi:armadillo repeat kinesin 2 [Striga asiatica]|uniref:Protein ARMADILLO REPEAT KINESIN1 n=1 Tax=Striga asiatica TaxID=4170 RepID=A0A5A7PFD1_STRAF|nr:armadillo repeat kinesin 2 [Striga asiatica]